MKHCHRRCNIRSRLILKLQEDVKHFPREILIGIVFIGTRFDDWVFCDMRISLKQSMQLNRRTESIDLNKHLSLNTSRYLPRHPSNDALIVLCGAYMYISEKIIFYKSHLHY